MTDRPFIAEVCICCESPRLQKSPAVLMPFLGERIFGWRPVRITDDWGMRTLETGMAYPAQCAADGWDYLSGRDRAFPRAFHAKPAPNLGLGRRSREKHAFLACSRPTPCL